MEEYSVQRRHSTGTSLKPTKMKARLESRNSFPQVKTESRNSLPPIKEVPLFQFDQKQLIQKDELGKSLVLPPLQKVGRLIELNVSASVEFQTVLSEWCQENQK